MVASAVGLVSGPVPGQHAEEAGLGVDGPEPSVRTRPQPRDVVAERAHLVAARLERRDQHREVGLAAGRGEGRGHVVDLAVRQLELEDQHVLGHPALVARERRGDPQREALLAEQRVAAVAGADAPDRALFREVHDEAAVGREVAERVEPRDEVLGAAELLECGLAHARHDPHARDHVRAVGDLDAHLAEGRAERAHHVGHHVERAALHRALEQREHALARLLGRHPVVRGPGVRARAAGDEREVLRARHVRGVAAVEMRAGRALGVKPVERAVRQHPFDEPLVLGGRAVAPDDAVRAERPLHLADPVLDRLHVAQVLRSAIPSFS